MDFSFINPIFLVCASFAFFITICCWKTTLHIHQKIYNDSLNEEETKATERLLHDLPSYNQVVNL
jgi:hypothetical protein